MNDTSYLNRRDFLKAASGAALALGAFGSLSSVARAQSAIRNVGAFDTNTVGDIPLDRIGIQIYTVRDLLAENELGLANTLELLADAGIAQIELAGDYLGLTATELRMMVEDYGLVITGNHFGPRSMTAENRWYTNRRSEIFAEAKALGLEFVGTGHYYNIPLTVDGFREFAKTLNIWGEDATASGLKFYFHNHDGEFTQFDNKPIYDILLEETDPDHVHFELDIGWAEAAGINSYELIKAHSGRFPYFHVKDIKWDDANGFRESKAGTLAEGRRYSFANLGKGDLDWQHIFSALESRADHVYFIEHDDAGRDETVDDNAPQPPNPAGSANTVWTGRKYLSSLEVG